MGRFLLLASILGAAVLVAAALLRPGAEEPGSPRSEPASPARSPVRLVGRPSDPIPPPGHDLASALRRVRAETNVMRLKHWAIQADDARVRRDAVVRLVDLLGGKARPFLLARVADEAESPKVRAACARLLGRAGTLADLEAILDATMPRRIHAGAAAGLVDLGETTPAATYRLEAILRGGCAEQRDAVVNALSAEHSPWKRWLATSLAQDACIPPSSRARLINGLGAQKAKAALPTLERLAVATNEPTEVRVAAARALGILGMPHGREALETIASDAPVALRRASTVALQRLARREQEER